MTIAAFKDAKNTITIEGLLLPAAWDKNGNIIAVAVSTNLEEQFRLDGNPRGNELPPFVRQRVMTTGLVTMDERGRKIIGVEEYEILDE